MTLWNQSKEMELAVYLWFCILVLFLIRALIQKWSNRKINTFMKSIPGPMSIPLIGNAYFLIGVTADGGIIGELKNAMNYTPNGSPEFNTSLTSKTNDILAVTKIPRQDLCQVMRRQLEKYPIGGYWLANQPYLVTSDRDIFNAILASPQNINKSNDYHFFKAHCEAIFRADGEEWRKARKLINPSFRTNVLTTFTDKFSYHTKEFLESLEEYASGVDFDVFVPVHLTTIDFVCHNMMGCQVDAQKKKLSYLSINLQRSTEAIFKRSLGVVERSDFIFSLLGKDKQLKQLVDPMRTFVADMLEQQIHRRNELRSKGFPDDNLQTFINVLLSAIETGAITKEQAREEMVEMFIAGSITTATAISWIFKILAMRPDIQEKVYREILDSFGHREITSDDLSRLVYLDMVVKETLRLYTVPMVGRTIVEDLKVDEKTTIPAGVEVLLIIYGLHTNPDYWERPGEFYPEHFSPSNEARRPKGAYTPFLSGPRNCLGNKYAKQSVKFVVANTILHYEFSTDEKPMDSRDSSYRLLFMVWPVTGFRVQIKKRSTTDLHISDTG